MACGLGTYSITMVIYFGIGVDLCNDLNVVRCRSKHSKDAAYSPNNLEELFPTSPLVLLALRSVAFLVKQNVYIDTCIHIYIYISHRPGFVTTPPCYYVSSLTGPHYSPLPKLSPPLCSLFLFYWFSP